MKRGSDIVPVTEQQNSLRQQYYVGLSNRHICFAAGENLDFSEALQIVQSAAGKQPREKELLTLTRHIPEFSGASGENVQDFLHGVDRVLT